jgi:ABC-2 type transport system permease protein
VLRSVSAKTVRDHGRAFLWWVLGLVATVWLTVAIYPTVRGRPELNRLVQDYPEAIRAFLGEGSIDFVSAAGYLSAELFSLVVPLVFLVYAIGLGAGAIAREEEDGTLDLLLAHPVSRRRLVAEKAAGSGALVVALGVVLWLALWAAAAAVGMDVRPGRLAAATAAGVLLALAFGALALLVGCATGKRSLATGASAAAAVAAYLVYGLAPLVSALEPAQKASPYYLYAGGDPIRSGLDPAHALILAGLALLAGLLAVVLFERRDLRV